MSAALALDFPPRPAPAIDSRGAEATLLRLLTCGSVDDGKSTLIGRLLFDSHAVPDDQLAALGRDSKKFGTRKDHLDFALLVDGLAAEREQGITIDVAYRYFSTRRRSFIVADTPGHEQYTRNMATGASTADLAIILIDATKGVLPQTRRHSGIVSMLGVRHVVLAVNKMDLVRFDQAIYRRICDDYRDAVSSLGFTVVTPIPLCARDGDNIATRSDRMSWYGGPILLDHLETVQVEAALDSRPVFQFPVQWVNRPNADFRGYAGTIASGSVAPGDAVTILPGGQAGVVSRVVTADGDLDLAREGQAVTLTLAAERDVSRGDVIVTAGASLSATHGVTARLLWMAEQPMAEAGSYLIKLGTAVANASVARLRHAIDIHGFMPKPASSLTMNDIGVADLRFDKALVAAAYRDSRALGAFILIDRMTNQTVAMGMVESAAIQPDLNETAAGITSGAVFPLPRAPREAAGILSGLPRRRARAAWVHRLPGAAVLFVLAGLVTRDPILAGVVAVADALLRPAAVRAAAAVWPDMFGDSPGTA